MHNKFHDKEGGGVKQNQGMLEIKRNGAGRVFFVLRSLSLKTLLISQSFKGRKLLDECVECFRIALGENVEINFASHYPSYEVYRDEKGILMITIFKDPQHEFLLTGGHLEEEEVEVTLSRIRSIINNLIIVDSSV